MKQKFCSMLFMLLITSIVIAQDTIKPKPSVYNRAFKDTSLTDVGDLLQIAFNKKGRQKKEKVKNFQAAVLPTVGYSLQTGFAVVVSGNAGFSTNRKDSNQKLSTIVAGITYSLRKQIIFPFIINIWTKKNSFNIISDNRFVNYPNYVFGVGDNLNPDKPYTCAFSNLKFHESILKEVAKNTNVGLGFFFDGYWNIDGFDSIYPVIKPSATYSIHSEKAVGLGVRILYDSRLNQLNPRQGFLSNIIIRKNLTALGSDNSWSYVIVDNRFYLPLSKKRYSTLALWNYNWITLGEKPTNFLLPSNGWDDMHNTGRGYMQGRFRGKSMFTLEAECRLQISKNGLFGATLFGNAMHFDNEYFYKQNNIKFAGGVGLRIKLNKYSSSNLCIDYAWGQGGSQGFFVNVGEMF